jgi:hypothetical protein
MAERPIKIVELALGIEQLSWKRFQKLSEAFVFLDSLILTCIVLSRSD